MSDESQAHHRQPIAIEDEMKSSYLDYAMSVIIGRALPDVRDGLKPVHRRVLYAMHQSGNTAERAYRKSAKTVGEVIGKFHPHGDQAVYDTIVRLAQDFSLRYPLIDGQGNFGSVDGDPPAAMRYTEIRMDRLAGELLADIDKETVEFGPNYDSTEDEPLVLPCAFPNLLANGSDGIAVGMATKIPPHNLGELVEAARHLIDHPDCSIDELMAIVKGPDFPTAGEICGVAGIRDAYRTGRGKMLVRGKIDFEEGQGRSRDRLVVSELPFQVNKVHLIEEIAGLVRDKKIDGIADIRDESDRHGIRLVLELKKDAPEKVVTANLFKQTKLQITYGAIFLAIHEGRPKVLDLKRMLQAYLAHRRVVVVRRTQFLLAAAEARAHIVEGLTRALDLLDAIIALIRGAASVQEAKDGLIAQFGFSAIQAQAILDMRLQRLTQLERQKLLDELAALRAEIDRYRQILGSAALVDAIIGDELTAIREKYADERRTRISAVEGEIDTLSLIPDEAVVVTLSDRNYVKRTPLKEFRVQGRGGKGIIGVNPVDEDSIRRVRVVRNHDTLLWFTSAGRVYPLPVHEIPASGRDAKGRPISNLLGFKEGDERVQAVLALRDLDQPGVAIATITLKGTIKKTALDEYANIRTGGLIALTLDDDDELISVHLVGPEDRFFIATREGMAIQFEASEVRSMGRPARGVRGIGLRAGDEVVSASVVRSDAVEILTLTERGFGKRTPVGDYRLQGRAGFGVINLDVSAKTGKVVSSIPVEAGDGLLVATRAGKTIRTGTDEIRSAGRNTQGVRIIRLDDSDVAVSMTRLAAAEFGVAVDVVGEGPAAVVDGPEAANGTSPEIGSETATEGADGGPEAGAADAPAGNDQD